MWTVEREKGREEIIKGIIKDCFPKLEDIFLNVERVHILYLTQLFKKIVSRHFIVKFQNFRILETSEHISGRKDRSYTKKQNSE